MPALIPLTALALANALILVGILTPNRVALIPGAVIAFTGLLVIRFAKELR